VYVVERDGDEVVVRCKSANNEPAVPDLRYRITTVGGNPCITWITAQDREKALTGWRTGGVTPTPATRRDVTSTPLGNGLVRHTSVIGHNWDLPDWRAR
jgi:hypothetical protein